MKRYIFTVFLTLALSLQLPGPSAASSDAELKDVIAAVEKSYESLADLQASFSQKAYIPSVKREQTGNGKLFIRMRPGGSALFRFDYAKPKQLIVSNGSTVWFYLPENRQVMVTDVKSLFEEGNGLALSFLTGIGRISRDFKVSKADGGRDGAGNHLLELVPKAPSRTVAKLRLTVSAEAVNRFLKEGSLKGIFPIVSSMVFDPFGTRTVIEFSDVKVNGGISRSLFTFKPPAGVEVIRQ